MPDLDKARIIQGTPKKVIKLAHEKMKSNYTVESAKEFESVYKKYDLPVILESSRYIFSEPGFGLPYYKEIMESGCIPFHCYYEEREKIHEFLESFKNNMNDRTRSTYTELLESVNTLLENHKSSLITECRMDVDDEKVMKFCAEAVKFLSNKEDHTQQACMEAAFDSLNEYEKLLYGTERATDLGLEYYLNSVINKNYSESVGDNMDAYSENMHLIGLMNFIGHDKCMMESVEKLKDVNLKLNMKGLMLENTCDVMESAILSNIEVPDFSPVESVADFVGNMFESVADGTQEYIETVNALEEYDNQVRKYIAYNDALAYVMAESVYFNDDDIVIAPTVLKEYCDMNGYDVNTMTIKDAETLMIEAVAELEELIYTYEYTKDGTQTAVIRNHATGMRETIPSTALKPKKDEEWKKNLDEEKDDDDDDSNVKDALEISDNETGEKTDISAKGKPALPKRALHEKIQAKALDADVKTMGARSAVKRGVTNVVQTGKAILRVPGHIVTDLKTFFDGWKNMDENARKEAMLKPGYRKKFYKKLRSAIVYGVTWAIHPYLAIAAWFCRKASKEKNQYIRNELAMELQTEIKVCEEKIEDAKNKDDQKEKYRLMRIRDKLEKERVRVISNAKYV